jgi:hypothetical protein
MIASRSVPDPCVSVSATILFPSFFLLFSRRHFSPRPRDLVVRTAGQPSGLPGFLETPFRRPKRKRSHSSASVTKPPMHVAGDMGGWQGQGYQSHGRRRRLPPPPLDRRTGGGRAGTKRIPDTL